MDEKHPYKACEICRLSIDNIKEKGMAFQRKVSYAGRSLIITVPEDIAKHMGIERGSRVRIVPIDKGSFLVEKI